MSNLKLKLKINKIPILVFLVLILFTIYSFYNFYNENFGYLKIISNVERDCYNGNNINAKHCQYLNDNNYSKEQIKEYIDSYPTYEEKSKTFDVIKTTSYVVEHSIYTILQLLSPLLIIIAVVGKIHSEYSSGYFKNYLMRSSYKKYLKQKIVDVLKISLFIPFSLVFIFLLSCIFCKFNFNHIFIEGESIYSVFKYEHFFTYGLLICISQYFLSFVYGMLGLFASLKNRNALVSIIVGYIYFLLLYLFTYIILYVLIINKVLGFKNLTDYFNLSGFWFFGDEVNMYLIPIVPTVLFALSYLFFIKMCSGKEGYISNYEKNIEK